MRQTIFADAVNFHVPPSTLSLSWLVLLLLVLLLVAAAAGNVANFLVVIFHS